MGVDERIWGYEFERHKGIRAGQLLLSEPFMFDENFRRTVVLICEHSEETGTVGLIVNKPVKLRLNEIIDEFPPFKGKMFLGGPVGTDTIQFIHTVGDMMEGSIKIAEGLYWGGNFEQLKILVEDGNKARKKEGENVLRITADDIHFYLGYSGWSQGQLEEELRSNSWIIADATQQYIFQIAPDNLWKEVMKNMGGVYDTMSGYPENPMLN